ncbi:MAG: restriction endonuclease subunit S [Burkholderiaceae bacterium]
MSAELTAQEPSAKYLVNLQPPLVRHFDLIAQAPGGVARLRELILTLAVQGKLVPQDPSDEPAGELLKKIRTEKDRLIAEGKIKRDKPLAEIADEEKPFDLPMGWEWVRFGEIAQHNSGKTLDKGRNSGTLRNYITTSNLYWGRFELASVRQMLIRDDELERCTARKGDLLICEGGEAGRAAVWDQDFNVCFQNHIHRARFFGEINPYYIYQIFQHLYLTGEINNFRKGVGISNMSSKSLASIPLTLPPLAEQSRIVTRVEELMQLCDALEASGQLEAQQHAQIVNTLLATLSQSETPEALADNWQRIATHFDVLLDRPESVDALEQTILQLAVRGLLVPQDPTDEPASVLLQKIRTEKDHLIAQGKIKRDKPLPPITDEEKPFELPVGWEWVRLGSLGESFDYGSSQKSVDDSKAVPILRMGNIQQGEIVMRNLKYLIDQEGDLPKLQLRDGDLLFNRTNSYELVGKTALFHNFEREVTFASYLIRIRLVVSMCSAEYVNIYMNTRDCRMNEIEPDLTQQTGQANYNGTKLKGIRIPVPPLDEQFRIVTRVNELRKICTVLRQRMVASRALQSHFAEVFSGG